MCGISGFVNFKSKVEKSQIEAMNEAIKHRGPDGRGVFIRKHKNSNKAIQSNIKNIAVDHKVHKRRDYVCLCPLQMALHMITLYKYY